MGSRAALLLTIAGFGALLLLAVLLGRQHRGVVDEDPRPSTYVTGPNGASGLYEALSALGVRVSRLRDRRLPVSAAAPGREAFVVLAPGRPVTSEEARTFLGDSASTGLPDVVLAGGGAAPVLRCFGYDIRPLALDSARTSFSREAPQLSRASAREAFFTHAVLEPALPPRSERAPQSLFGPPGVHCPTLSVQMRVDTLLTSAKGAVAVRLTRRSDSGFVVIAADAGLFRNRALKETAAGPFVLALLSRHERVVFDEYHQGFGPSGSLGRMLVSWSFHSPLGWAVWQAAVVGLLALLTAGVRFGPPLPGPERRRRASLEHVRALATALAAAHGHDVAIAVLLRGLRRRLAIKGRAKRTEESERDTPAASTLERDWLYALERTLPPHAREAVHTLKELSTPGQDDAAVLRAANAVEDVWDTLRHSTPTRWRR